MKLKPWHVFAAALALRLAFVLAVPQQPVIGDAVDYDTIGWNLASGEGFSMQAGVPTAKRPPLYPVFLAAVYGVAGHSYTAARIAQSFLGAFACLFLFLAAKELFGRSAALLASLICAVHPVLIAYSGQILNEALFTALLTVAMWLFVLWTRKRGWFLLVSFSIALAVSALIKPTPIFLPVLLFAADAFDAKDFRRAVRSFGVFCMIALVVLAPWTIRNYKAFGKIIPFASQHGPLFFYTMITGGPSKEKTLAIEALTAGLDESSADAVMQGEVRKALRDPARCAWNVAASARFIPFFWISSHSSIFGVDRPNSYYRSSGEWGKLAFKFLMLGLQVVLLAACAWGISLSFRTSGALLFVMPLFYFSLHFYGVPRYHVPVLPYVFAFSAVGFAGAAGMLRGKGAAK